MFSFQIIKCNFFIYIRRKCSGNHSLRKISIFYRSPICLNEQDYCIMEEDNYFRNSQKRPFPISKQTNQNSKYRSMFNPAFQAHYFNLNSMQNFVPTCTQLPRFNSEASLHMATEWQQCRDKSVSSYVRPLDVALDRNADNKQGKTDINNTHVSSANIKPPRSQSYSEPNFKAKTSRVNEKMLLQESGRKKLLCRRWIPFPGDNRRNIHANKSKIEVTVATYNVLAQNLLEDNLYLYKGCNESMLKWEWRREKLICEIKYHNFDIVCLQEINCQHYNEFFVPELNFLGYEGVYQKRSGDKQDGCAVFYKRNKFILEEHSLVSYYREDVPVLNRDNVAIVMVLCIKQTSSTLPAHLCIANTHLLFNAKRGDVKLAQLTLLLAEIDKLTHRKFDDGTTKRCPVIMCGDFNMTPFCELYKLIVEGKLVYEGLLSRVMSGQEFNSGKDVRLPREFLPESVGVSDNCQFVSQTGTAVASEINFANDKYISFGNNEYFSMSTDFKSQTFQRATGTLSHMLNFISAYKHGKFYRGKWHSEITTHTRHTNETVDFIFYTVASKSTFWRYGRLHVIDVVEDQLQLIATLELLQDEEMLSVGNLPNDLNASDHLLLAAKFQLHLT